MVGQRRGRLANISPALGQLLLFDCLHDTKLWRGINGRQIHSIEDSQHGLRQTERTRVNQHIPTSLWEGRHNNYALCGTLAPEGC